MAIHSNPQKAARNNNMITRRLLVEIFQSRQCALTDLDLIKKDQCFSFDNRLPRNSRQHRQKMLRINTTSKKIAQRRIAFKIKIGNILVVRSTKFQHRVGFPNLSGAL